LSILCTKFRFIDRTCKDDIDLGEDFGLCLLDLLIRTIYLLLQAFIGGDSINNLVMHMSRPSLVKRLIQGI
jgi:hypothetical protein